VTDIKPTPRLFGAADVRLGRQRSPVHESGPHMRPYLRAANVKDGQLDVTDIKEMNFDPKEQITFSLRPGDVLVTEGSGSLASVGASAVWNGELSGTVCFQNTLIRLRPREGITDARYLGWWARAAYASGQFASIASGANIYHISSERTKSLAVNLPSLEEQSRIADFLDMETAKINEFITLRNKQLALAREEESADIHNSVRGAPLDVPMSITGPSWLGQIADQFRLAAVSHEFEVTLGKMLNPERTQGNYLQPYLRNTNVQWDHIDTNNLLRMNFPPEERTRYRVLPGDLMVCEGGEPGRAALWKGEVDEIYYQKALHRVRPRGNSSVRWLYYCLRAATDMNVFAVQGNSTTIAHLTGEQLKAQRFPFPDRVIQNELIAGLDDRCRKRRAFRGIVSDQLALLDERRQALITAAVTGQIDVTTARGITV
jgi:type I restriction enzyme S subunit